MKTSLLYSKFIMLLLVVLTTGTMAMAQKTATASGDWSNPATWTPVGVPTSGQTVTINNGVVLAVDVANAACASLTFTIGGNVTNLNIGTGSSLTVSGAISMGNGTDNSSDRIINLNGGSLACGSLTMGNPGGGNDGARVNINSGSVFTVDGNITMAGSTTENIIDINDNGSFKVAGSITGGTCTPADGSTFEYSGTAAQSIYNFFYHNLVISGSGVKSLTVDRTMDGNLTIEEGSTLNLGAFDLTNNADESRTLTINGTLNINGNGRLQESNGGTKSFILGPTGFLRITDNGGIGLPTLNGSGNYGAFTFDPASTVEFGSTDAQTIENSVTYGNLVTSGSGTKTLETSGGTMNIAGSITIGSGTTLDGNDKTLNVGGNWTSNGNFTLTSTTVNFNGSAVQTISGSNGHNFNNLVVNGAGLVLGRAVTVNNAMTLTNGIVTTSDAALLSLPAAGTISAGSNASFINGPLAKSTNTTAAFTFPVGTVGGGLRAVTVTPAANTATTFTGRAFFGNPKVAYGSARSLPLTQVSNCEYWTITRSAGGSNASVTIPYSVGNCGGSSYVTNPATLLVARHDGTQWVSEGNAGAAGNLVTSNVVSNFSPFTLGTSNAEENPLPVTFSNVRAFEKNSGVQVEWSNMTEKDVVDYTVERSANGQSFSDINVQTARSNNDAREDYAAYDASPIAGTNYYRIRVREVSGKIVYSKILKVEIGGKQLAFSLYPNPVSGGQVTLGLSASQGKYSVQVVNANGQVILSQSLNHSGGNLSQQVQLPGSIKPGVYNMVIAGDNYRQAKTFIVQ